MGRPVDKITFDVPGSGTYNDMNEIHYNTLSGSKIGIDKRDSYFVRARGHKNPGPGTYKGSQTFIDKNSAPKFGFGTSSRSKDYIAESKHFKKFTGPGPGAYDIP